MALVDLSSMTVLLLCDVMACRTNLLQGKMLYPPSMLEGGHLFSKTIFQKHWNCALCKFILWHVKDIPSSESNSGSFQRHFLWSDCLPHEIASPVEKLSLLLLAFHRYNFLKLIFFERVWEVNGQFGEGRGSLKFLLTI